MFKGVITNEMKEDTLFLPQEFEISLTMKIFYGIGALALVVFSILLLVGVVTSKNSYMSLLLIVFILAAILILANLFRRKIIIDSSEIYCRSLFTEKRLSIADVKGYRADSKIIKIVSNVRTKKSVRIGNYIDFNKSRKILEWLEANFQDLNALDLEKQIQDYLKDETYGSSEDERNAKLKTAKELALAYNIWGGVVAFILLFLKQQFAYMALLIIPLLGVALLYSFNLIKFLSDKSRCIYPHIFFGFALPCMFLLIKTTDFTLLSNDNVWLPLTLFCGVVFPLLYFKGINKSMSSLSIQCVLMLTVVIIYGFGCFRTVNCVFDKSEQSLFKVAVLGKHISHRKSTTYHLQLNKWGPQQKISDERVSRKTFNNKYVGDFVGVKLRQGYLQAPWYEVLND